MRAPMVSTLRVGACHGAVSALLRHAQRMSPAKVHEKGLTPPVLCGTQCAPPPKECAPAQCAAAWPGQPLALHMFMHLLLGLRMKGVNPKAFAVQ